MIASVKYSRSWFNISGGKDGGGDSVMMAEDGRKGAVCVTGLTMGEH